MNIINTKKAPGAIGPYSQAISAQVSNLVFTSGQLPLDPNTMQFAGNDIKSQTRQSLLNVQHILEASGSSPKKVIKTTCFLADMNDFTAFNEVYTEFFGEQGAPARSCVEVARLPKDALVEIEAIALVE